MANQKAKRNINAKTFHVPKYIWDRFDALQAHYVEKYGFIHLTKDDMLRCMARRIEVNTDKVVDLMDSKYIFHLKATTSYRVFSREAYKEFIYAFKKLTNVFDKNFTFEIIVNLYWMETLKS